MQRLYDFWFSVQEDAHADVEPIEGDGQVAEPDVRSIGPPKATLTRRSQSYSDFHDAVRAVLGNGVAKAESRKQSKCEEDIKNDIDFVDWYHDVEHDLLDASHDEYKYISSNGLQLKYISHYRSFILTDFTKTNWIYRNHM